MLCKWRLATLAQSSAKRLTTATNLLCTSTAASNHPRSFGSSGNCKKPVNKNNGGTCAKTTDARKPSHWQENKQRICDQVMSAVFRRQYSSSSSEANPPPEKLPPLMNFPHIMWPKVSFAIRNWILTKFIIKPHMDKEFDIREFDKGARQALSFISGCLAKGKLEDLTGLVSNEALLEISENLQHLSLGQREALAVEVEDIYFSFPYQIGIIIPDRQPEPPPTPWVESGSLGGSEVPASKRPPQTRYVEITVAFHVLRGLAELAHQDGGQRHFLEFLSQEDTKYKVMVCNYRFWRDFTEGATNSSWIVNMVSHFLPAAEGH